MESIQLGLKVGANYSNVYNSEGEGFLADPKLGFVGGLFLAVPINRYLGAHPELLFSQRGFKATGTLFGQSYQITRTTNYLDIPLLLEIKPMENLSIVVGPQYSFLLSQVNKFENEQTTIEQEKAFDNENIRKNMVCFTGGANVNIEHLVVSARVGWDLFKNNGDGSTTTPRYKNLWYQLTLGYRL
jgi:hypothetical protein